MKKSLKEPIGGRPKEMFQQDLPGMPFFRDSPAGASGMLLRTASDVFSRWYAAMRSACLREQERQKAYRREQGYKASVKVPAQPLSPSDSETSIATASESVIRAMFGDTVADYAKDCFLKAMRTGDKRAFKIRLLMLKARDSLKGLLHEEFSKYAPIYISDAEKQAGCVQAPHGPRRMSNAEKAIKQRKEEARRIQESSPDLFTYASGRNQQQQQEEEISHECHNTESTPPNTTTGKEPKNQYIEKTSTTQPISDAQTTEHGIIDKAPENLQGVHPSSATDSDMSNEAEIKSSRNIVTISDNTKNQYIDSGYCNSGLSGNKRRKQPRKQPTIQPAETPGNTQPVVRKARDRYVSQSEIVEDIEGGKITMYSTPAEIVADMHADILSPSEAMMFLSVYGQISGGKRKRKANGAKKMKTVFDSLSEEEELDNEEEKGYEEEDGDCRSGSSAEWNPEDDW